MRCGKNATASTCTAELDSSAFKGHELEAFTQALAKYRTKP